MAALAPDQTATENSMTFIIAKPDTAMRVSRARPRVSVSTAAISSASSSRALWPCSASRSISRAGARPGASMRTVRVLRLTRASRTPGRDISARSTEAMQAAQWISGSDSSTSPVPEPAASSRRGGGRAAQPGQAAAMVIWRP